MNAEQQHPGAAAASDAAGSVAEATAETQSQQATRLPPEKLQQIIEAALLAAEQPLSITQLGAMFNDEERPTGSEFRTALALLSESCRDRGVQLAEVASGFRLQVRAELQPWISQLWPERQRKYSRALLETLALIAYRQPITRGEIEDIRGVSVSSNIMRTLLERDWVRELGQRDVPGRPMLYGTTKGFLDHFNLKSLDELPTLAEIRDLDNIEPELDLQPAQDAPAAASAAEPVDTALDDDDDSVNTAANRSEQE